MLKAGRSNFPAFSLSCFCASELPVLRAFSVKLLFHLFINKHGEKPVRYYDIRSFFVKNCPMKITKHTLERARHEHPPDFTSALCAAYCPACPPPSASSVNAIESRAEKNRAYVAHILTGALCLSPALLKIPAINFRCLCACLSLRYYEGPLSYFIEEWPCILT